MAISDFDHPLRKPLTEELHARPFIPLKAQTRLYQLVIMNPKNAPLTERFALFQSLCQHLKIEPPQEPKNYYTVTFGNKLLKWESHTEFSTYLIAEPNNGDVNFSDEGFAYFPHAWLADYQVQIIDRLIIEIDQVREDPISEVLEGYRRFFTPDAIAAANVLDHRAVIASDFQLDKSGAVRFLIMPRAQIGQRRLGRVVQRVCEIENYKTLSLLPLHHARDIMQKLPEIEARLPKIIQQISGDEGRAALDELMDISTKIENIIANQSYRYTATLAYFGIVNNRLSVLREQRVDNFQLFSEFMLRRYEPSIRTIESAMHRVQDLSERIERLSNLLRTKIDVRNAEGQNALLESMNHRSELQLRLQETVEGFSVVAISYYALSLLAYIIAPLSKLIGVDKSWLIAGLVPVVVVLVWRFVTHIKGHITK